MKKLLAASVLFLVANAAIASQWVPVASDSQGKFFIDKSSIKVNRDGVRYWVREDYFTLQKPNDPFEGNYVQIKVLDYTNCQNQTEAEEMETIYRQDGSTFSHGPYRPLTFTPIVPDSTGERIMNYVCKFYRSRTRRF